MDPGSIHRKEVLLPAGIGDGSTVIGETVNTISLQRLRGILFHMLRTAALYPPPCHCNTLSWGLLSPTGNVPC